MTSKSRATRLRAELPRRLAVSAPTDGAPEHAGPALPLLLIAGLGAAGACVAWLMFLMRSGGEAAAPRPVAPVPRFPPDVVLEAELQEILAEERLKRFADEHGRDMAEPGEPVRAG